jgi:hypothetical protein
LREDRKCFALAPKRKQSVVDDRLGRVSVVNAAQQDIGIDRETHNWASSLSR